jgi:hypothetical protein
MNQNPKQKECIMNQNQKIALPIIIMNRVFPIFLILFCFSCAEHERIPDDHMKALGYQKDTNFSVVDTIEYSDSEFVELFGRWDNYKGIDNYWIKVERDSLGYLIYDPCDGSNPSISIKNGTITVYWWLEGNIKMEITKMDEKKGHQGFTIYARNDYKDGKFDVKIVDADRKLVLWDFILYKGDTKSTFFSWIMTNEKFSERFRKVDNPCPENKIPEKKFLPNEYK